MRLVSRCLDTWETQSVTQGLASILLGWDIGMVNVSPLVIEMRASGIRNRSPDAFAASSEKRSSEKNCHIWHMILRLGPCDFPSFVNYCASFACSVTRSKTTEFQHNDIMMKTTVQNDLRLEMALESMWIVCPHGKSNN